MILNWFDWIVYVYMCVLFCSNYWWDLWCICVGKREAEEDIDKEVPVKKLKLESEAKKQENAASSDFEEEQKVQLTTCKSFNIVIRFLCFAYIFSTCEAID